MESIVLVGILAVIFGAGTTPSDKSRSSGWFLTGLVAELSRNYSEKKVVQRVDSAARRSTCQ